MAERTAADDAAFFGDIRRREFPDLRGGPYLNAASIGPVPGRANRALEAYGARRANPHELRRDDFEPLLDRARAAAARLINASPDEIALLPNTSFGINLAAHVLPVEPGRRVVVSAREFPANVYPWMQLGRSRGVPVEVIPADSVGRPDEARLLAEVERGDVGILALSAVQYIDGHAMDLEAFGAVCRRQGTWFVVDAIQALGQVPVDVRAARIDVLAAAGQKWLCAPFGTGFAFVREELISRLEPMTVGWTAMRGTLDYSRLTDYRYELWDTARRFEVATQPFHDQAAMTESMTLIADADPARVRRYLLDLLDPLIAWLRETGFAAVQSDLRPERRSGILAFQPREPEQVLAALGRAGVSCVLREGAIRLSPHLYNTSAEIGRVIEVLEGERR